MSQPSPVPCLSTGPRPVIFLLLLGLALAGAARAAEPALPRAPSPVHTPLVTAPAPGDAPGYREELTAIAERYTRHYYAAELAEALGEARRGLARAEQAGNAADEAQFVKALGYVSWVVGDTAAALDFEQRLLVLADRLGDDSLRANAHRTLGTVYRQLGERAKGRQHTATALGFAERAGDDNLRYGTLNNLAVFALDEGDTATARRLLAEVLAFRERQGERWDIAGCLSNLADVASAERNHAEALALHERALALRREIGDERGVIRSLRQVAGALRQLGRTDEALARLDEALARAQKIAGHELLRDIWQEITLAREARGEFAAALAAERETGRARDALAGERARIRIAELQTRYDDARKQATILRLEREQRLQAAELRAQEAELGRVRLRNIFLSLGLVAGLLLLGGIIWVQRARLRAERLARDTAEQATALRTGLLRMVSHDIRGPVGNILVQTEDWCAERAPGATDERMAIIQHETRHVLELAGNLLDAAALEAGGLKLTTAPMSLTALAGAAVSRLQATAARKDQKLILQAPPGDPCLIQADAARLDQVIRNLIGNALKYSPRRAAVRVAIGREDNRVRLAVQDEGPGISADDLGRLFVPFSRLAARTTGGEPSHGLGLSIAHDLVKLHGGTIRVDSVPGRGTTFVVELPALA